MNSCSYLDRIGGRRLIRIVCAVLTAVLTFGASPARACNVRGQTINDLKQIMQGLRAYQDTFGHLPEDICDDAGTPLLSWRVRLLPFVEHHHLYKRFHLDEPWDSPRNRELIARIPKCYAGQMQRGELSRTCYLRPRGQDTLFPAGRLDLAESAFRRGAPRIFLVEVDEPHAVIWTKPDDLDFDTAHPRAGLTGWGRVGFFRDPASAVVLTDGSIRCLTERIDTDTLRALFSPTDNVMTLIQPWYAAFLRQPWCSIVFPSSLIGLCIILSGVPSAYRLLKLRPISPGEALWLIVGVDQLIYWLFFLSLYRIDLLPSFYFSPIQPMALHFLPLLAGTAASIVPLPWCYSSPQWRLLFAVNFALWCVAFFDASPPSDWTAEESLLTAAPPFFLATIAMAAMVMTWIAPPSPEWEERRRAHWLCLYLCLIPALSFSVWMALGFVEIRPLFVRILD